LWGGVGRLIFFCRKRLCAGRVDAFSDESGCLARVVCLRDAAGGGDEDTEAVGTQTGLERRIEVSSLGADSGGQQPGVGRDCADVGEGFGIGCADDQAYGRRPAYGFLGYTQKEKVTPVMFLSVASGQFLENAGGGLEV